MGIQTPDGAEPGKCMFVNIHWMFIGLYELPDIV
jgi:hypothetical protein